MFLYQRMRCGASPGTVLGGVRSHGTLRGRELFMYIAQMIFNNLYFLFAA